ncbi:unnamed protein product [Cunninghamella blakesleeana]
MKPTISTSFLLLLLSFTAAFAMYNPYDNPYHDYYDPYYEMDGPGFIRTPYDSMMDGPPLPPPHPYFPPPPPNPASTQNAWNNFVQCYLSKCSKAEETCFKSCLNDGGPSSLSSLNPPPPSKNHGDGEEGGDNEDDDDQA